MTVKRTRRPDPLAAYEPRSAKVIIAWLFVVLVAMVIFNIVVSGGILWRIYAGAVWFGALVLILVGARLVAFFRAMRSMRWKDDNRCPNCGYCLTANMSGACPECGTAVR